MLCQIATHETNPLQMASLQGWNGFIMIHVKTITLLTAISPKSSFAPVFYEAKRAGEWSVPFQNWQYDRTNQEWVAVLAPIREFLLLPERNLIIVDSIAKHICYIDGRVLTDEEYLQSRWPISAPSRGQ